MFKFLEKLFPGRTIKTETFEKFMGLLDSKKCESVEAEVSVDDTETSYSGAVGAIGNFKYRINFEAPTPEGKKITYSEEVLIRFGSERGFADASERGKAALKALLTAEKKLNMIKGKYPNIKTDLVGPVGKFNDDLYKKLHEDAATYHIEPA